MKILNLKLLILLEYQNIEIFLQNVPIWSGEVFVIKKVKNTVLQTYVISDFKGKELLSTFYEKEFQKANKKEFRVEKVIQTKGYKLYVKWKGYDNSFNSWIEKKRHSINNLIFSRTENFRMKSES